jgi:hypothetical protein
MGSCIGRMAGIHATITERFDQTGISRTRLNQEDVVNCKKIISDGEFSESFRLLWILLYLQGE